MSECVCTDMPSCDPAPCEVHRHLAELRKLVANRPGVKAYFGDGCSRLAFRSKSGFVVYKVPRSKRGLEDNEFEAYAFRNRIFAKTAKNGHHIGDYLARCRLAPSGVLVMLYLDEHCEKPESGSPERPEFLYEVDDDQGGMALGGRYLIYDYALRVEVNGRQRGYWWGMKT